MSGLTAASLSIRRASLAVGLCLLAFLFAVEAKTARYGPEVGPGSDVRAEKALPVDIPKLIERGVTAPDPVYPQFPVAILAVWTVVLVARAIELPGRLIVNEQFQVSATPYFSPNIFFRPPPAC
jgi:hypothetical protein